MERPKRVRKRPQRYEEYEIEDEQETSASSPQRPSSMPSSSAASHAIPMPPVRAQQSATLVSTSQTPATATSAAPAATVSSPAATVSSAAATSVSAPATSTTTTASSSATMATATSPASTSTTPASGSATSPAPAESRQRKTRKSRSTGDSRPQAPKRSRKGKVGRAQAFSEEELQKLRENAEERKKHLNDLVNGLPEEKCRELLIKIGAEQPAMILEIMDFYRDEEPPVPAPPTQGPPQPHWCVCGNCRVMQTATEDICCRQNPENCLSTTPEMHALCLDRHVLYLSMLYRADVMAMANLAQGDERLKNASLRHAGYRQHVLWQYGRLGRGVRVVVPSCVVWKIRTTYPDASGQYVPFRPARV